MYDFLSYGSYNNNEMSGVYVYDLFRVTIQSHDTLNNDLWKLLARLAPHTSPTNEKEGKKERKRERKGKKIAVYFRYLANSPRKPWMAPMESTVHLENFEEFIHSLSSSLSVYLSWRKVNNTTTCSAKTLYRFFSFFFQFSDCARIPRAFMNGKSSMKRLKKRVGSVPRSAGSGRWRR